MSLLGQQQQCIINIPIVSTLPLVEIYNNNLLNNFTQKLAEELPNNIDENTTLWNEDLDEISD